MIVIVIMTASYTHLAHIAGWRPHYSSCHLEVVTIKTNLPRLLNFHQSLLFCLALFTCNENQKMVKEFISLLLRLILIDFEDSEVVYELFCVIKVLVADSNHLSTWLLCY